MNLIRRITTALAALALLLVALPMTAAPASASTCNNPKFVTSDPNGMWNHGKYVVHNNLWNASGYNVSETLKACGHSNWYVNAKANNSSGDGAVKTYPNVHRDFHNWSTGHEPRVSSFSSITSSFAARSPRRGIYNVAYDIWLNGVPGRYEVMIWTDNYRQTPAGSVVKRGLRFSGRTWKVWATGDNGIITFVPKTRITRGTMNIKARLTWLRGQRMIPATATLGQICFGVEVVSTGGDWERFKFDKFTVSAKR